MENLKVTIENGKLKSIENWKDGKKNGEWEFYYKSGQLERNSKLEIWQTERRS